MSLFRAIANVNKCNHQLNISIPKRKISKKLLQHLLDKKPVKIRLEE